MFSDSFVIGALSGVLVGLLLIYINAKQRGRIMSFEEGNMILSFFTIIGSLVGICHYFDFKPPVYSCCVGVISGIISYIICVIYGLHEKMTGYPAIISDATGITIMITLMGMIGGFIYGIYLSI